MSVGQKTLGIRQCTYCGKDIEVYHKIRMEREHIFCCRAHQGAWRREHAELNATCPICGKKFHLKPHTLNDGSVHCCSRECDKKWRSIKMSGSGNHQYGLKGELNASWKSNRKISYYGYVLIRKLDHPFRNSDGFVFEHRLVAEKYLLTEENSIEINGKRYLKPEYCVHHKDFNRQNNDVSNLIVLDRSYHESLHKRLQYLKEHNMMDEFEKLKESCIL